MALRLKVIELNINDTEREIYSKIVAAFAQFNTYAPKERFDYPALVALFLNNSTTQI